MLGETLVPLSDSGFEFNIALVFHKSGMPLHIALLLGQFHVEIGMSIAVNGHTLEGTIHIALIRVEEAIGSE